MQSCLQSKMFLSNSVDMMNNLQPPPIIHQNVNKLEKWTRKGLDETHLVVTDELAKKFSQWEKDYYLCLAWNSFHKYPWTTQIRASLHCNKQKDKTSYLSSDWV